MLATGKFVFFGKCWYIITMQGFGRITARKALRRKPQVQKKPVKIARIWSKFAYNRLRLKLLLGFYEFYERFNQNHLTCDVTRQNKHDESEKRQF